MYAFAQEKLLDFSVWQGVWVTFALLPHMKSLTFAFIILFVHCECWDLCAQYFMQLFFYFFSSKKAKFFFWKKPKFSAITILNKILDAGVNSKMQALLSLLSKLTTKPNYSCVKSACSVATFRLMYFHLMWLLFTTATFCYNNNCMPDKCKGICQMWREFYLPRSLHKHAHMRADLFLSWLHSYFIPLFYKKNKNAVKKNSKCCKKNWNILKKLKSWPHSWNLSMHP